MTLDNTTIDLDALPGGDQDVQGALPPGLAKCLADASRVILVANNPAISQADIDALHIGADDVVVSFNTCSKYDLLKASSVNVFVHGFNAPDHYFFGLPHRAEVHRWLAQPGARSFTILVGCAAPMCAVPGVMLLRDRIPLPPLWNYPVDRPGGKRYVGPSTGFNAMVLFEALRTQLGYGYQVMALGFSTGGGKLWGGHAWEYEREWLAHSAVTAVPLKGTPARGLAGWWARVSGRC
jgi:hypothetical protein